MSMIAWATASVTTSASVTVRLALLRRQGRRSSAAAKTAVSSRSRSASIVALLGSTVATRHRRLRPLPLFSAPTLSRSPRTRRIVDGRRHGQVRPQPAPRRPRALRHAEPRTDRCTGAGRLRDRAIHAVTRRPPRGINHLEARDDRLAEDGEVALDQALGVEGEARDEGSAHGLVDRVALEEALGAALRR